MKYLWYKRTKCKYEPTPAEKRRQLMKSYTFRIPCRKQRLRISRRSKGPEDIFPDGFKYRSTCKPRSYQLSKYFDDYLETVTPPQPEPATKKPIVMQKKTTPMVQGVNTKPYVNGMYKSDIDKEIRAKNPSNQVLERTRERLSSTLWNVDSADVVIKQGIVNKEKLQSLYGTKIGSTLILKEQFDPLKVYNWGEQGSGLHSIGPPQDFKVLREKHYKANVMFEDPCFPAAECSICYTSWKHEVVGWKRPMELCVNPKLFFDGISRFDVQQGSLGNCWMLAALSSLTMRRKLFFQVVPVDQAFDEMYAGIFHFRLWNDGKWVDVVIDDRLPVNADGKLCFTQISNKFEFWPALLEKAYAKMQGTYEHIEAGQATEAFVEFTGGLVEIIRFNDDVSCYDKMKEAWDRDGLICISSKIANLQSKNETILEGLVLGHSYTVTNVIDANFRNLNGTLVSEKLIRIRNPWGNFEWTGAWSERSHEWNDVPHKIKEKYGLKIADDGEFFMCFADVIKYFSSAHICHIGPALQTNGKDYILSIIEGEWVKGISAGGPRNEYTYNMNPQYLLRVSQNRMGEKTTRVIISLLSKNRRRLKHIRYTYLSMNISLFPIGKGYPKPLPPVFFKTMHSLKKTIVYEPAREVIYTHDLPPGTYVVIPSTWNKCEGEFLLRFYSEEKIKVCPYDNDIGIDDEAYVEGYGIELDQHSEIADLQKIPILKLFVTKDVIGIHTRDELLNKFLELAGTEEVINWKGLQTLLEFALESLIPPGTMGKEICRSFIALHDVNSRGALNLISFLILWTEIVFWVENFDRCKENTNEMGLFTLRNAIYGAGFRANVHLLNLIMHRYGNKMGRLNLHDFLMVITKFKHMIEAYKKRECARSKKARFNISQFFVLTIYC